ncbi:MAG: GNAT family N-acetyltransferase [Spirochaetales bacterium]|nr:GNAT family N-acetyltransferase [Spirochaetales bacterium]
MRIERLEKNDIVPYDLLLEADPYKAMIDSYIHDSSVYVARNASGAVIGIIAWLPLSAETAEIKNIAVHPDCRNRGIGTKLIGKALREIKAAGFSSVVIGTGNTSRRQRALYEKLGFRIKEVVKGFFTKNYPFPIEENGAICEDMVVLEMEIGRDGPG